MTILEENANIIFKSHLLMIFNYTYTHAHIYTQLNIEFVRVNVYVRAHVYE